MLTAVPGTPGRTRTCDLPLRRRLLYPLSYGGSLASLSGDDGELFARNSYIKALRAKGRRTSVVAAHFNRGGERRA
jgi:hypothetical protein